MQHLLTFELSKDGDELVVHADERGLRFLSQAILRLAEATSTGKHDHIHLMTADWSGNEMFSIPKGADTTLLHHVKLIGWPKKEAHED